MKSFLLATIILFLLLWLTPSWWWVMVVPLVYGAFQSETGWKAFRSGMLMGGSVWLVSALYLLFTDADIIARRVALMFTINNEWLLLVLTTLVALVAGGFSAMTGTLAAHSFSKKNPV
jgi:hypothetical protein